MKTTEKVIHEKVAPIKVRAYRDFGIGLISKEQLEKIIKHSDILNSIANEIISKKLKT